ncbi:hypothetical protein BUE80_DR000426 [Diplocarpon rosae]|nr:hypothetical protein BUE80_DR000426 [Diplocarpon rosae]
MASRETTTDSIESMKERGIPVANLSVISLAKLHAQNPAELALLEKESSRTGFFYLDMRGHPRGECVLAHLPGVFAVEEQYFAQSEETKTRDARHDIKASQDLGWKLLPGGESFELSRDEVVSLGASSPHLPPLFKDEWERIADFTAGCDEACLTLLSILSADFVRHHRIGQPGDTGLKMVLHPSLAQVADAGAGEHTDSGTITLLFYTEWGIRAYLPNEKKWAFLPPLEGCALINVANSLQRWSGGKFHSPKHGVTQPLDGARQRYYLSYFLRPENALLERWRAAE